MYLFSKYVSNSENQENKMATDSESQENKMAAVSENQEIKMDSVSENQTQCLFNKFGHCKFNLKCRNYHTNQVCEANDCEIISCIKRHPKKCRFYESYGRCKLGNFCSFLHSPPAKSTDLDVITKLDAFEKEIAKKDNEIQSLRDEINKVLDENLIKKLLKA